MDTTITTPSFRRSRWLWGGVMLAGTAAVGWLLYLRWREQGFDWKQFSSSFLHLNWSWLLACYVLSLLTYVGRAVRWAVMIEPIKPRPGMWNLLSATAIGFTALVLLGRPGELVRPYLIARNEGVPLSSQIAAWFLERICDLLAVLLVFGFTLTQIHAGRAGLGPGLQWALQTGGYVVAFAAMVCLAVLLLLRNHSDWVRSRLLDALRFLPPAYHHRLDRIVTAFVEGTASTKSHFAVFRLVLYTVLEWALITAAYVAIFKAYRLEFRVQDVLIFIGFVSLGSIVQIPAVGGGMQLVSVVVLNEIYKLPLELATSITVMQWISTIVIIVPIGLLLAFHEGLNWKELKHLKQESALDSAEETAS